METGGPQTGGVFALWHLGVRPQWVYVGAADDLASAFDAARNDPDMLAYDRNGGLYVAWADLPPEQRPGVVVHLRAALVPAVSASPLDDLGPGLADAQEIVFPPPEERTLGAP